MNRRKIVKTGEFNIAIVGAMSSKQSCELGISEDVETILTLK